jgi:gluconolactonase
MAVTVISPDGGVEHHAMPDPMTTNICFGGPDEDRIHHAVRTGRLVAVDWPSPGSAQSGRIGHLQHYL